MAERQLKKVDRTERPTRRSIKDQRDTLTISGKEPGFHYRVVKTTKPGRIDKFLEAGYEIVLDRNGELTVGDSGQRDVSEGTPVKINLGRGEIGYLMRQRQEWYDEDQNQKETELREQEASMLNRAKQENFYGKLEVERVSEKF